MIVELETPLVVLGSGFAAFLLGVAFGVPFTVRFNGEDLDGVCATLGGRAAVVDLDGVRDPLLNPFFGVDGADALRLGVRDTASDGFGARDRSRNA